MKDLHNSQEESNEIWSGELHTWYTYQDVGVDVFNYTKSWKKTERKEIDFSVLWNQITAAF